MRSKKLSQIELPIGETASRPDIPDVLVAKQPNITAAVNLCINASGLDDKAIYLPLKIDPGHWTRIRHGKAHFPLDQLNHLMDLCGNDIPLRWMNVQRGQRAVPLEDAKDARIRLLDQQVADLQKEIETLIKYDVLRRTT